jgi:hypothetical protein
MSFAIDSQYTLAEILKAKGPDGSYMPFVDVLTEKVPLIEESFWEQSNEKTHHEMLRIVSEPQGGLTRLNEGGDWVATSTKPVVEGLCYHEAWSKIASKLAKKATDPVRFRLDREKAIMRGMIKGFHTRYFYGDSSVDEKDIDGLRTRYKVAAADSVIDAGGTGTTYSLWILKHGVDGVMCLYPPDAKKTIQVTDLSAGKGDGILVEDDDGKPMMAFVTSLAWQYGIGIADDRCVKRIGKVNATVFPETTTAGEDWLIDLIEAMPDTERSAIYGGSKMTAVLRKRLNAKGNLYFTVQDVWGRKQLTFQDLPVIKVSALDTNEAGSL